MISIAGGCYKERCIFPAWNQLYGSGVRAAAAISKLCSEVSLHTYCGAESKADLSHIANDFGFSLHVHDIQTTLDFTYFHALGSPEFHHVVDVAESIRVEADNVLRFGFVEGGAVVTGRRVVYDPQSRNPISFWSNGSQAEELVMVLNIAEAQIFSGERDVEKMASSIFHSERLAALVIKAGTHGAYVFDGNSLERVPCYKTKRVFPIGSGDIFSALFAYHWNCASCSFIEAAQKASLGTAYYCENSALPIPDNFSALMADHNEFLSSPLDSPFRVYLASPFFTISERWLVNEVRSILRSMGASVFSPVHEVGAGPARIVVPRDIKGIEDSDILFAIVDGQDSGTIFEIGYAKALGKPVVVFVQNEPKEDLKMMQGTGCVIEKDLATALYKTMWMAS